MHMCIYTYVNIHICTSDIFNYHSCGQYIHTYCIFTHLPTYRRTHRTHIYIYSCRLGGRPPGWGCRHHPHIHIFKFAYTDVRTYLRTFSHTNMKLPFVAGDVIDEDAAITLLAGLAIGGNVFQVYTYIYINICIYVYVYVYMYICICITHCNTLQHTATND